MCLAHQVLARMPGTPLWRNWLTECPEILGKNIHHPDTWSKAWFWPKEGGKVNLQLIHKWKPFGSVFIVARGNSLLWRKPRCLRTVFIKTLSLSTKNNLIHRAQEINRRVWSQQLCPTTIILLWSRVDVVVKVCRHYSAFGFKKKKNKNKNLELISSRSHVHVPHSKVSSNRNFRV